MIPPFIEDGEGHPFPFTAAIPGGERACATAAELIGAGPPVQQPLNDLAQRHDAAVSFPFHDQPNSPEVQSDHV